MTTPESLQQERANTETTFALGMAQILEPLAVQHTETISQVQKGQRELDDCIHQLKAKLEDALQYSSLPQVGTYLAKLGEIKKRVTVLSARLNSANERLVKTHRYAEAQFGTVKASNEASQKKIDDWLTSQGGSPPPKKMPTVLPVDRNSPSPEATSSTPTASLAPAESKTPPPATSLE
ncbi:hypothetical protein DIPPA_06435 [Diplonema papillatum]|nr:hypothetical protein DIPPA_06435 [Diplonema papillatum]